MVEHHDRSLDRVFVAVSDPTRRALLAALARRPATVTQLARPFRVSLNAISKHLKMLERAGLIRRQVIGREHHCGLNAKPLGDATAWLEHYRQFWDVRLDGLERFVVARQKRQKRQKSQKRQRRRTH